MESVETETTETIQEQKTFTEEEINSKWQGSWAGKAPGDPFIVRGGYNCRHHWLPIVEDE